MSVLARPGRPLHIRWGGGPDFQDVADVARALVRAAEADVTGAPADTVHGEVAAVAEVVDRIHKARITGDADTEVPVGGAFDDDRLRAAGRVDTRELG
jgi:nucleoside-diphosphate-sugar epimerase